MFLALRVHARRQGRKHRCRLRFEVEQQLQEAVDEHATQLHARIGIHQQHVAGVAFRQPGHFRLVTRHAAAMGDLQDPLPAIRLQAHGVPLIHAAARHLPLQALLQRRRADVAASIR